MKSTRFRTVHTFPPRGHGTLLTGIAGGCWGWGEAVKLNEQFEFKPETCCRCEKQVGCFRCIINVSCEGRAAWPACVYVCVWVVWHTCARVWCVCVRVCTSVYMWYGCDVYKCAYEQRGMGVQVRVVCVYVYECAHGQCGVNVRVCILCVFGCRPLCQANEKLPALILAGLFELLRFSSLQPFGPLLLSLFGAAPALHSPPRWLSTSTLATLWDITSQICAPASHTGYWARESNACWRGPLKHFRNPFLSTWYKYNFQVKSHWVKVELKSSFPVYKWSRQAEIQDDFRNRYQSFTGARTVSLCVALTRSMLHIVPPYWGYDEWIHIEILSLKKK